MRTAPLPSLTLAVVLLATACAAGEGDATPLAATQLAEEAEALAEHLERDDPCGALDQAELLLVRARDGHAEGEVTDEMVDRVEHVTQRVQAEYACEPQAADTSEAGEEEPTRDDDVAGESADTPREKATGNNANANANANQGKGKGQGKGEGKGKGKGKGRGNR